MSEVGNSTVQVTPEQLQESLEAFTSFFLPRINDAVMATVNDLHQNGFEVWDVSFIPVALQSIIGAWIIQNKQTAIEQEQMFDHLVLSLANQLGVSLEDEDAGKIELPKASLVVPH